MACRSHLVWGLPFFRIGRPDSLQDGARRSAGLSFEPHAPEVSLLALGPGARVGVDHGDLVARVQYSPADLYLCSFYRTARPFLPSRRKRIQGPFPGPFFYEPLGESPPPFRCRRGGYKLVFALDRHWRAAPQEQESRRDDRGRHSSDAFRTCAGAKSLRFAALNVRGRRCPP